MNTNKKSLLKNLIIFFLFISITFYFILKNCNINDIFIALSVVDIKYIIIAVFAMCFFVFAEGLNIYRTLKIIEKNTKFISCIKYAFVGFFFSSITPSASGGDPMQIYYMKKDGIDIGKSSIAILTEFSSFQFVTITMSIIGFLINYKFINNEIGNIKYLLLIGVLINLGILILIIISAFSSKLIKNILNIFCSILNFFHYKNTEKFRKKAILQIEEYRNSRILLMNNKKVLLKIILTTFVQIVLYHSIPYFVYLSMGLSNVSFISFISVQAVLYISVSSLPLPGAVGVSEGGFLLLYTLFFPKTLLNTAMLLSRGISFYLFVLITGIAISIFSTNNNFKKIF